MHTRKQISHSVRLPATLPAGLGNGGKMGVVVSDRDAGSEEIRIDLDTEMQAVLRRYQRVYGLSDLSTAARHLLLSALIEWETRRRRVD